MDSFPEDAPKELPAVRLKAVNDPEQNTIDGTISGEVELRYIRSELHRELKAENVEEKLNAKGVRCQVQDHGTDDGDVHVDHLRIDVRSAAIGLPVIRSGDVQPFRLKSFLSGIEVDAAAPHWSDKSEVGSKTSDNGAVRTPSRRARRRKRSARSPASRRRTESAPSPST
ncbi:hypothetical protein ACI799_07960 [Blastococcus sp. SYSU DS0753]